MFPDELGFDTLIWVYVDVDIAPFKSPPIAEGKQKGSDLKTATSAAASSEPSGIKNMFAKNLESAYRRNWQVKVAGKTMKFNSPKGHCTFGNSNIKINVVVISPTCVQLDSCSQGEPRAADHLALKCFRIWNNDNDANIENMLLFCRNFGVFNLKQDTEQKWVRTSRRGIWLRFSSEPLFGDLSGVCNAGEIEYLKKFCREQRKTASFIDLLNKFTDLAWYFVPFQKLFTTQNDTDSFISCKGAKKRGSESADVKAKKGNTKPDSVAISKKQPCKRGGVGGSNKRHKAKPKGATGKSGLQRLARRGGVKRMSALCNNEVRSYLQMLLENVLKNATAFTEYRRCKTVTLNDILCGLAQKPVYGF